MSETMSPKKGALRLGCCGSIVARQPDGTGIEIVERLADMGFDYIELSLSHLMALNDTDFARLAKRLERSGLRCEACNNFFPPHIRLTGEEVRMDRVLDYVRGAFSRASRLGAEIVVFGSSGAKNVPEGFPHRDAWRQIVRLLQGIDPLAEPYGITVAIEPLNQLESNIVTTTEEAIGLAREVAAPRIKLVVDYYHLKMERESPDVLVKAGELVRHLHFAEPEGRVYPARIREDTRTFFSRLRDISYVGRMSLEAFSEDFPADAERSLSLLRRLEHETFHG